MFRSLRSAALSAIMATSLTSLPHLADAADVPPLDFIPGQLTAGGQTLPGGELAIPYPVDLTAGQAIQVELAAVAFEPYIVIADLNGHVIAATSDEESGSFRTSVTAVAPATGSYQIMVTTGSAGQSGAYLFGYRVLDPSFAPQEMTGQISKLTAVNSQNQRAISIPVPVLAGRAYQFDHLGDGYDAYLSVVMPDGSNHTDDDGGEGLNSRLNLTADRNGVAQVTVRPLSTDDYGTYTLAVGSIPPVTTDPLPALGALSASGTMEAQGPSRLNQMIAGLPDGDKHVHTIQVSAPGQVSIISNTDFDGHLYLLGSNQAQIADNDDHGSINASRIDQVLQPGVYHVVMAHHNGGTGGTYQLVVVGAQQMTPGLTAGGTPGAGSRPSKLGF